MDGSHNQVCCALDQGLGVGPGLGVGAGGGVGAAGRSPGGIIHGAPAGSRVGCCGNQCCAHGRTASFRLRPEQEGEVRWERGEGG